jgi:drug/metabolite transporter (DMT)-like permease
MAVESGMPPERKLSPTASLLAILCLSCIWGYHWAVMKIGLGYCGALTYSAMRCLIAAPLMLALVKLQGRSIRLGSMKMAVLVGVVQTSGNFGLGAIALEFGEAGKSAVLAYTMPFWVLLFGYLLMGDRAGPRRWIAALLAVAGTLVVALAGGRAQAVTVLFAVAAGLTWGAGVVLYKWSHDKYRDEPVVFAAWQLLYGGIAMALCIPLAGEGPIQWTPSFIAAMSYTTVLATACAVYLFFTLIARLEAGMAALGILLVPVIALVSGWIQLGERPPPIEALGLGIILAAIAFNAWAEWRRAHLARRTAPTAPTPPARTG